MTTLCTYHTQQIQVRITTQRIKVKKKSWFTKSILCYIFLHVFYAMDMSVWLIRFRLYQYNVLSACSQNFNPSRSQRAAPCRVWMVRRTLNVRHVQWLCGLPQKHYNRNNTYTDGNVHLMSALWAYEIYTANIRMRQHISLLIIGNVMLQT